MARSKAVARIIDRSGFLPVEVRELSHTSRLGIKATYFQAMMKSRWGLKMNAIRYKWSDAKYRMAIKELYIKRDALKFDALGRAYPDVWKMLRYYEERVPVPEDHESPWRKRISKKLKEKRKGIRTTRRGLLQQWIADLNQSIKGARSEPRKAQFELQRGRLQAQLDRMV